MFQAFEPLYTLAPITWTLYKYYKSMSVDLPLDWSLNFIFLFFKEKKEKKKKVDHVLKDIVNSMVVNSIIWVIF